MTKNKWAIEKAAQVWCRDDTGHIEMNVELAMAFAEVLEAEIKKVAEECSDHYNAQINILVNSGSNNLIYIGYGYTLNDRGIK